MRVLIPALPLIAGLLSGPALAEEGAAARLIEAHRLAELGRVARDPVLLFAAARLVQGVTLREGGPADWAAGAEAPDGGSADLQGSAPVPDPASLPPLPGALEAAALFEAARQMAPEDSALRDAIGAAAEEVPAAPLTLLLRPEVTEGEASLAFSLPGGSPVQIGLLTLEGQVAYSLTTPGGEVLCQDASATPGRLCTVTLAESQTLTLTTKGQGHWLLLTP